MKQIQYLDSVIARNNWPSYYRLAQELGISTARMSLYKNEKLELPENLCLQVANLLEIDPAIVLLEIRAQWSKCSSAAIIMRKVAHEITASAAALILTLSTIYAISAPTPALASSADQLSDTVYYVKYWADLIINLDDRQLLFFTLFLSIRAILALLLYSINKWKKPKLVSHARN